MAVYLRKDAQAMVKEPHIDAVQFVSVDVNAHAVWPSYEPLLRDQGPLYRRRVVGYLANPKSQALISQPPYVKQVRVDVIQGDARHYKTLSGRESAYLGSAARFTLNPAKVICCIW